MKRSFKGVLSFILVFVIVLAVAVPATALASDVGEMPILVEEEGIPAEAEVTPEGQAVAPVVEPAAFPVIKPRILNTNPDSVYFGVYPQNKINTIAQPVGTHGTDWVRVFNELKSGNVAPLKAVEYYDIDPIEWNVLENNNDKLVLVSKNILTYKAYGSNTTWATSQANAWLNGGFLSGDPETSASINAKMSFPLSPASASLPAGMDFNLPTGKSFYAAEQAATSAVTLPSIEQAQADQAASGTAIKTDYTNTRVYSTGPDTYFSITPSVNTSVMFLQGMKNGVVVGDVLPSDGSYPTKKPLPASVASGYRPVITIDKSKVMMALDVSSTIKASGTLAAIPSFSGSNVKLTVMNSTSSVVSMSDNAVETALVIPGVTTLTLTTSTTLINGDHLAYVIIDEAGEVTHYGQTNGTTVDLPATLVNNKNYLIRIFAEKINPAERTDFASAYKEVKLSVNTNAAAPPTIDATAVTANQAKKNVPYKTSTNQPVKVTFTGNPSPKITVMPALPAGLTLDENTGEIKGTPTTTTPAALYTFIAYNGIGMAITTTAPLAVADTVAPAYTQAGTINLAAPAQGIAYSADIKPDIGLEPVGMTYTLVTGTVLPSGITVTSNGTVAGTTNEFGSFTFDIKVDNGFGSVVKTFNINMPHPTVYAPPAFTTGFDLGKLPENTASYKVQIGSTGYPTPQYSIMSGGFMPGTDIGVGLTTDGELTIGHGTTGTLPQNTYTIRVAIKNTDWNTGTENTEYQQFKIVVDGSVAKPQIQTTTLPGANEGDNYSANIVTAGSPEPVLTLDSGSLPTGLSLSKVSANNYALAGTPTAAGTYSFTLKADNGVMPIATQAYTVVIVGASVPGAPTITTVGLGGGSVGSVYNSTLAATGGTAPYTFSAVGLPAGLTISASGQITGTPTLDNTYSVTFTVIDSLGASSSKIMPLVITPTGVTPPPPPGPGPVVSGQASIVPSANPMTLQVRGTGTITVNLGGSGVEATVSATGSNAVVSTTRLTTDGVITVTGYSGGQSVITVNIYDANKNIVLTQSITVIVTGGSSGGSSTGGSSGGGGGGGRGGSGGGGGLGGGSSNPYVSLANGLAGGAKSPVAADQESLWKTFVSKVPAAAQAAKAASKAYASASIVNADVLTVARAKSIAELAQKNGSKMSINADVVINKAVALRIVIKADLVDRDIKLGGITNACGDYKVFNKYYANKLHVIHFNHQGEAGQKITAIAKLDLKDWDTDNIVFYTYNKATNKVVQIKSPNYKIDKNGYIYFDTTDLYDIVVSEGKLIKK